MKRLRTLIVALAFSLFLGLAADVDRGPMPKWLGIEDHEVFPENPREFNNGEFADFPDWKASKEVPNDTFTFARLRYSSSYDHYRRGGFGSRRRGGQWTTDYPDADIDLSYRLQQMTSMQVNPNAVIVDIEAEQLRQYPFIYCAEPGNIDLTDDQAKVMRDYMLNGGFWLLDDFWGYEEWEAVGKLLKQLWPDRQFVELELEHDIFHCVFDLKVKPQIPGIGYAEMARRSGSGQFFEWRKEGSETVHYRAVYDDRKRMCMLVCWNTDNGDGWEEEGTDPWYFREFSEKYAYPLAINIIFYAMTH